MTSFPISHDQAKHLAAFLNSIRGDWDKPGILDALAKARDRADVHDLAIAAIRASLNAKARTPAVIGMDGAHWREPEPQEQPTVSRLNPGTPQHDCHRDGCRGHETPHTAEHVARIKAQLRRTEEEPNG